MKDQVETVLQVEDLKTYFFTSRGVAKAVDGVSFHVGIGETLGLVGESGCGKTVTGMSILRLVPEPAGKIVGGSIFFRGEDLLLKSQSEMRKIRGRHISMILQDPLTSLNPAFTVGDQIYEAISLHQRARGTILNGKDKVFEALRMVKIPAPEKMAETFPHQLSGGMRQRVAGAIALSCRPSLLIADEPTTSLDVTIQAQYLGLLKELQEETGVSMIFITHDFGIVAKICNRVAVMYAGKIVEIAETRELFNHPLHPYTLGLMACLPTIEVKSKRLANITGQPPDVGKLPPGCSFAARCSRADEICWQQFPSSKVTRANHQVSCWYAQ